MSNKSEQYVCLCGEPLGEKQGYWFVYPNPAICPNCGRDNTEDLLTFILEDK